MRKRFWSVFAGVITFANVLCASTPIDREGIILWLDAADSNSVIADPNGNVIAWKDKSGAHNDAVLDKSYNAPSYLENGINNKPSLRFSGNNALRVKKLKDTSGELSFFIVYRRTKEFAGKGQWQRLVSGWDGITKNDTKEPSFFLDTEGKSEAIPSTIAFNMFSGVTRNDMIIGKNMSNGTNSFSGDIAEIIVYDKSFYIDEPIHKVKEYLQTKWKTFEDTENNWTLRGPMSSTPARTSNTLPLIDQANKENWTPYMELWDEFDHKGLNEEMWWPHHLGWPGRAPGRFSTDNVAVFGGKLAISMDKPKNLEPFSAYRGKRQYHTYTSGCVVSKKPVLYGYFEIRAKAMKSRGSSSWWFQGTALELETDERHKIEIDMFEIGGAVPGKESSYNMNLHVFKSPTTKGHYSNGNTYKVSYKLADEYHTYGFYWGKDYLQYYIDGTMVRSVKNTHWHSPMQMYFDSETMIDWLGEPQKINLPSTYTVDYIRSWKNKITVGDWEKTHKYHGGRGPNEAIKKWVIQKKK